MTRPDTFRVLEWPVIEPVSLTEAKHQLGLMADQTEHDQFIVDKIAAARRLVETRLGITLVATHYRATWKDEYPKVVHLPAPPLLVASGYDIEVTIDGETTEEYSVDEDAIPGQIEFGAGGTGDLVVTYWGGVTPGTRIDPMIRSAILLYVTHLFENRGVLAMDTAQELPQAFETLLAASSWNGGW